jgi:hypothetical protein
MSRLRRAGSASTGHAHHPVAARIDEVEMVLERLARRRREPLAQGRAIGAQDARRLEDAARVGGRGDRGERLAPRRGAVVDQPELVDTTFSAPSVSCSWRCSQR